MLLSTYFHTGFIQDVVHNSKYNGDYIDDMADINDSESVYHEEKESVDDNLSDKEAEELYEVWRERMELMAADSKPQLSKPW